MHHPISPGDRVKVTGGAFVIGMAGRVVARYAHNGAPTLVDVDLDNGQRVMLAVDQVARVPYVARHLGAPDTAWKTQAREQVARALSVSPTRGTLRPRGAHADYARYQPFQEAVRRDVDRPRPVSTEAVA